MTDLLIVGGGAAGLMAAGAACARGLRVTVLEHNPKGPGQKLLITGKGRCNVTSDSDVREFLPYVRHNGRFLYSSLYAFPPSAAIVTTVLPFLVCTLYIHVSSPRVYRHSSPHHSRQLSSSVRGFSTVTTIGSVFSHISNGPSICVSRYSRTVSVSSEVSPPLSSVMMYSIVYSIGVQTT